MQIDRTAALFEALAVGLPKHRAAACRDHARRPQRQFVDDSLLQLAESFLPFTLEEFPNGQAKAFFNNVIGVQEGSLKAPGELAPNGGLPGAGKAHKSHMSQWMYGIHR